VESGAVFLGAGLIGGVGEEGEGGTAVSKTVTISGISWRSIILEKIPRLFTRFAVMIRV
jgi:hypothetical protein